MGSESERPAPRAALQFAVFFGFFFLWTWLRVDPTLHYEARPSFPIFVRDAGFLVGFLSHPGGPAAYLSALLSQAYCCSGLGAAVITLAVAGLCLATDRLVRAVGGERAGATALVPGLILLVALNAHASQLEVIVGPALALLGAAAYVRLAGRSDGVRIAGFLLLAPAVYYVTGGAYLLFALVATLFEVVETKRRLPALVCLLGMEVVPYLLGISLLMLSPVDAFLRGVPGHADVDPTAVGTVMLSWVSVPLVVLVAALWRVLAAGREPAPRKGRRTPRPLPAWWSSAPVSAAAVLVVAGATALLTYDRDGTAILRMDVLARHGQWPQVLAQARSLPRRRFELVVCQHVNRALYETGALFRDMFSYPQGPETLMVDAGLGRDPKVQGDLMQRRKDLFLQLGDLDLELGLVNETEHEAHESLTTDGPHPEVLRRLALANIVKRQPEAAQVFLDALGRQLVQEPETRRLRARPAADPAWDRDAQVARVRSVMLLRDEVRMGDTLERRCPALLGRNPHNRMAFEYLMAYYLLTRQLEPFAANLPRLKDMGYPDIPRLLEEGALVYERNTRRTADCGGRRISGRTREDFLDFVEAGAPFIRLGDMEAAQRAVAARFGNTYFYYFAFGVSGAGKR